MKGTERLLLLSAVNWYEKYCEEKDDAFDAKEAVMMIAEDCFLELDEDVIDKLVFEYERA